MTPCCQIGAWPDRERVDADLLEGVFSDVVLARKYRTTKDAIAKHRVCLERLGAPPPGPRIPPDLEDDPLPGEPDETNVEEEPKTRDGFGLEEAESEIEGVARAPVFCDPKLLRSRQARVEYIANLVAVGRWNGRRTARRLARLWDYSTLHEVYRMRREAQTVLDAFRGPVCERRDETVGRLQADARRARKLAVEPNDLRVAVAAEVEAAKIDGVYPTPSPAAAVTVVVERARGEIGPLLERLCRRFVAAGMLDALTIVQEEAAAIAASEGAPLLVQAVDPARDG